MTTHLRRTVLFMPGDSLRKIEKATQLEADCIVLDLEDGVALNQKDEARRVTAEALQTLDFGRRERVVRLNPPTEDADIEVTIAGRPDSYMLPKVEQAEAVQRVSQTLADAEAKHGLPADSIGLIAVIETALGVMNLREIAQSSPRLNGLLFGAEDFASSVGAIRTPDSWEVFYARSAVVTAAAAYQLEAIDQVFFDLHDLAGLAEESRFARQLGYTGKSAIHPRQLAPINHAFTPSAEEIERAKRLLAAHAAHQADGLGAFAFEGQMVDGPVIRAAERIVSRQASR